MSEYAAELIHQGAFSENDVIEALEVIFRLGLNKTRSTSPFD
jgi:hypothetical protein